MYDPLRIILQINLIEDIYVRSHVRQLSHHDSYDFSLEPKQSKITKKIILQ